MIYLFPMHRRGQEQFVYFYQLRHPDLRTGFYIADYCREI